ncbi:MAG TPA: HEAT repeat domain-containing protein [Bacillota bacterium]|nr:HEAT repeat domain-containing protein [Bacillota bacterium]
MFNSKVSFALAAALLLSALTPGLAKTAPSADAEPVSKLVLKSQAGQKEKADACRELARIGTKEAVAPLAALLSDEQLSHMARYGLETIPDPAVDTALREALKQLQGRALAGVIGSIGVRRDAKAVQPLSKLLEAADPEVAQAAAKTLGRIGTPAAAEAIQKALPKAPAGNRLAFCEGLFRCAEAFASQGRSKQAVSLYDQVRAQPTPHQVRTAALRGAILTRQPDGLPLLLTTLRDNDFALFATAVRISQEMPSAQVTSALAAEVEKLPADKQIVLIQALGRRGDVEAIPALTAAATKCEKPVRIAAIRALAQLQNPLAAPLLQKLMGDADREIAQAAQESFAGMPGKEVDAAIMALLAGGDASQRVRALDLISRRRMTAAIAELFKVAGDTDAKVRVVALNKLGELAGPEQMPALLDVVARSENGADLEAAEQALRAVSLKTTDREACAERLTSRLGQVSPAQKCALLRVLGSVGGSRALQTVKTAVQDANPEVHAVAIRALGSWSSAEAAPSLLDLARTSSNPTDKMLCLRSYLSLAGQPDLAAEQRLGMCREAAGLAQKPEEKRLLLAALGSIQSPAAVGLIQPHLDDPATREEASLAIVTIAEKLLQGKEAKGVGPQLAEPLGKVAQVSANVEVAKKAKALLQKAK